MSPKSGPLTCICICIETSLVDSAESQTRFAADGRHLNKVVLLIIYTSLTVKASNTVPKVRLLPHVSLKI